MSNVKNSLSSPASHGSEGRESPNNSLADSLGAPRRLSIAEALQSARDTRLLRAGSGVLSETPAVFQEQFPHRAAIVVADATTWTIAGARVQALLISAGIPVREPYIFQEPSLYAEYGFVERLLEYLSPVEAIPVAVGSGTINDLVKLAAGKTGRPYLTVATAASMGGYTAFGASITYQGSKQTFDCPAPRAVIADTDILSRAPCGMTAAGFADLQAKITAGADWILADALGVEAIHPTAWDIVQGGLGVALADPSGAKAGNSRAIGLLTEGLMLGGFAMQLTKSSRPASGAEHQFSHLWDMEHHVHGGSAPAHGFKVGVATLAITALYEFLLNQPIEELDVASCVECWPETGRMDELVHGLFDGTDFLATALAETRAKQPTREALREQLGLLKKRWPEIRMRLRQQLVPFSELKRRLCEVGAPSTPEEIGIPRSRLRSSFVRAMHIRRRFTVLDMAARTALLEPALQALFGPGGEWEIQGR